MTREELILLYPKLIANEISDVELDALLDYFRAGDLRDLHLLIREELDNEDVPAEFSRERVLMGQRVLSEIRLEISKESVPLKKVSLWPRLVGIAAAVALVVLGVYFFKADLGVGRPNVVAAAEVIVPGKSGATLTLASGKKIRLSDAGRGELAKEAGVVITKSADGELVYSVSDSSPSGNENKTNTLSTAKGETYQVRLPDGSLVWLNAASSLTYPADLNERGERRVRLEGEGYFEIFKDKRRPFVVQTARQDVEVLGTHFNVSAYADDQSNKTTLTEGSVQINKSQILTPGQQAITRANKQTIVTEVNPLKAAAWKNGKFVFDNERIEDIMRMLSRWYNVEVQYIGDIKDKPFTGSISRADDISKILDKITCTQNIQFKIEGRRITVMP